MLSMLSIITKKKSKKKKKKNSLLHLTWDVVPSQKQTVITFMIIEEISSKEEIAFHDVVCDEW
jgi:hypothetical protein